MGVVGVIVVLLRAFLLPRAALIAENLSLRQQLAVFHHARFTALISRRRQDSA